jgi:ParB family chromosome partitioning protein
MPRKGLNKKRGLESLIPNLKEVSSELNNVENNTGKNNSEVSESESTGSEKTEPASKKKTKASSAGKETSAGRSIESESVSINSINKEEKAGTDTDAGKDDKNSVLTVRLSLVVPNKNQPRKEFNEETIDELAESIKQYGVIQPLIVQKKGRYYELIAGERRWRAARKAGLKEVPVILKDFSEQETMEVSLIENIQRQDLNPVEEAEAYQQLIDDYHLTQEEVASKVGKSRAAVANSLRLLKLTPEVREMLIAGKISMGHARALLALEDPDYQKAAAEQVVLKQLSVRETEALVKNIMNPPVKKKKPVQDEQTALAYRDLENRMQKRLGTKVSIHSNGKHGKIEIEYYSEEDLERILAVMNS